MTVEAAAPSSLRSFKVQSVVGAVSLAHGATHWTLAVYFVCLPAISAGLGLSYTEAGLLTTGYFVGSMIFNLPAGIVVDLTGRRILYQLIAVLLNAFGLAALGFTDNYILLWCSLAIMGGANMLWHPAAITYLSIQLPKNRGYSMAVHSFGASLGESAAPLITGWMLAMMSWERTVQINSLVGVVCAALIILVCGRDNTRNVLRGLPRSEYWSGLLEIMTSRAQWSFFLMAGLRTMTQTGLLTFLPLFLANEMHMSPVLMGMALMAMQLGGLVATPIAGILSDRIGRRPIVMGGMFSTTIIVVLMTFITNPAIYIACISVLGFVMYASRPVVQSWQMDRTPPELLASVTSALFTVQAVLSTLAPIIGGFLADRYGLMSVFYFLAASVLVGNLLCFMVPRTERDA